MISKALKDFTHVQTLAGFWSVVALILAWIAIYLIPSARELLDTPLAVAAGSWSVAQPASLWINEAGAALIFLVAGLELKRGFLDGELTGADRLRLPALGALGGLCAPMLVHAALGWGNPALGSAWFVPLGSDMAIGLAVLALFGDKAPAGLKLFFLTTCLFMNIGTLVLAGGVQIVHLSTLKVVTAGTSLFLLAVMNFLRVGAFSLYAVAGIGLWAALVSTGPLAGLAGLTLAFAVPMHDLERIVLSEIERDLHRAVGLILIPTLFAINSCGMEWSEVSSTPWALGVAVALFAGKQIGIFGLCWLGVKADLCALPPGVGWWELHGAAVLCGVGGGTALTWNALAGAPLVAETTTAVLGVSTLSALGGFGVLRYVLAQRRNRVLQRT